MFFTSALLEFNKVPVSTILTRETPMTTGTLSLAVDDDSLSPTGTDDDPILLSDDDMAKGKIIISSLAFRVCKPFNRSNSMR